MVIAFGHHTDNLAQATLLNLLFGGRMETIAPRRNYFKGKIHLIRRFCYTHEKAIRRFARANADFPTPPPEYLISDNTRRQRVEGPIQQSEGWAKKARTNFLRAGLRGNEVWGTRDKKTSD